MPEKIDSFYEPTEEQLTYIPSEKEKEVVDSVVKKFRMSSDDRDRNFEYFDGRNIYSFIDDSVRRYLTNIDERDGLEDWQARVNDKFTRNKVVAVLGRLVSVLPIAQFSGRGDEDVRKGNLLTNLYEYSEDVDNYERMMIRLLLEAIVKGTAVGYEGVSIKKRKLRNVKGVEDSIKITQDEETETSLPGILVPLEEFYPSSVSLESIEKMPFCFWRKVEPYSVFISKWGNYDKSRFVQAKRRPANEEERPYYLDFVSVDVQEGEVEIIRYYDKENDHYVILANGVWLNPIKTKEENEEVSPLPWNHKQLPFWDMKFEIMGDFFYGNSLPNLLKPMQDVLNVLTNMLLDQSFLTIFPPLLTNGYDSIEDDYLRPGRRTPIDTQGLPISQAMMKLDLGTPSGWHQYILEYTRKIMEESSIDRVSAGAAGVGGRTTAQEIRVAAEGVAAVLGVFGRLVNHGIKRKAFLRGSNILQYWTDPKSPMLRRINGEDGTEEFGKVFNTFKLNNAVLTEGKRGTKIVELYSNKNDLPTKRELQARALVAETDSGTKTEIVALPGEYLRNFLFDIKLVSNPKSEKSKELERALQLEKVRVYMSFFPNIVNVQELAAETAEKMGDDPTKILNPDVFQPPTDPGRETDNGVSTTPTENNANNLARSARGGEQGGADLAALQQNLLG